ncbi:MAG: type II secretion system protein [Minisyncoccia bacterium]
MNKLRDKKGFTLIEMTVSLGLFTIIMFIATSAFLSIVNTDRKARSVRIAADNLNIALEDMSRRIKTGSTYNCGGGLGTADCPTPLSLFAFTEQDGTTRTTYSLSLSDNAIFRGAERITSPEINITGLKFLVSGSNPPPDTKQPMVTIVIDGSLGAGVASSTFKIQTTVTQRVYDN